MAVSQAQLDNLLTLTRAQLRAISQDFRQPDEVQEMARELIRRLAQERLRQAVQSFEAATPVFADLTQRLVAITEKARATPGGDAVGVLGQPIRLLGDLFDGIAGVEAELQGTATADPAGLVPDGTEDSVPAPAAAAGAAAAGAAPPPATTAPPPGTVKSSSVFSEIAAEYVAMFDAMRVPQDKDAAVTRQAKRLASFRREYEKVGSLLNIPWYFIGLIHGMESSFNFGLHLHNGDPLNLRTTHVPKGRPPADVADPPFAWSTSAIDALRLKNLQTRTDWSLPAILFRLEQYNGFGYRRRGLATPYLWSFSDRHTRGRFVRDGVFDPNAVSKQVGAAVMLGRLIQTGDVARP